MYAVNKERCLVERLASGELIASPVIAIFAHPDDETIGMGGRLSRLDNLTLVHVTDGAPRNMARARELGFESTEDYSRARFSELTRALFRLGVKPKCQIGFGISDGEVILHLTTLIDRLEAILGGYATVITHAYEGGHPDHDACALAVQVACVQLAAARRMRPLRLEFACYYSRAGKLHNNSFSADPQCLGVTVQLSRKERKLKRKAMREFRTQSWITGIFPVSHESYREAPMYDFLAPPSSGEWFYDRHNWPLKGKNWLEYASIGLDVAPSV